MDVTNTTNTFTETPNVVGTWEFRVVIQSGTCSVTNSSSLFIQVQASSAGAVTGGSSPICLGSSTGIMTLAGHTGAVTNWQSSFNGGVWTDIVPFNTTASDTETPAIAGSWSYRAVTNSGTTLYSAPTTIVVNPATVGGTVDGWYNHLFR